EISELSVAASCRVLRLSRATYYRSLKPKTEADMSLRVLIQQAALEWPSYGYRRTIAEPRRRGQSVNRKQVLRLMREDNLLILRKRRFVHTTDSDHRLPVYPNLVPGLSVTKCDQLWVSDITYIRLLREFIHLAVILYAFSRRVIGWGFGALPGNRVGARGVADGTLMPQCRRGGWYITQTGACESRLH
ncbi:MAG: IS3 family transposase, partial [Acidobacteria bacterium]|nr:IS3 family transposase [Acidobacteriota bacterium]